MVARCRVHSAVLLCTLSLLALFSATCLPVSAGLRFISVKPVVRPGPLSFAPSAALATTHPPGVIPPIEGPLIAVPIVISDQNEGELEFFATVHYTVEGAPLAGETGFETAIGLLDSGASTH